MGYKVVTSGAFVASQSVNNNKVWSSSSIPSFLNLLSWTIIPSWHSLYIQFCVLIKGKHSGNSKPNKTIKATSQTYARNSHKTMRDNINVPRLLNSFLLSFYLYLWNGTTYLEISLIIQKQSYPPVQINCKAISNSQKVSVKLMLFFVLVKPEQILTKGLYLDIAPSVKGFWVIISWGHWVDVERVAMVVQEHTLLPTCITNHHPF